MKNFLSAVLILFSSSLLCGCASTQKVVENKILTTFKYASDSTYSRAIAVRGNKMFVGNSDGYIYKVNLHSGKPKKISKTPLPELRDIHVIGRNKIIAMQSADSSNMIYLNGRKEKTFSVSKSAIFLDGMDIGTSRTGFMMGDPTDGYFSLFKTIDSGRNWTEIQPKLKADEGEAGFAASGTTVQCLNDSTFIFVSGGIRSRFFKSTDQGNSWIFVDLPFEKSQGSGPFSILFTNEMDGILVGGDYTKPNASEKSCFYTRDGGKTWNAPEIPPSGYRSSIIDVNKVLYTCGTNGIDYSRDNGKTWISYLKGNYVKLLSAKHRLFVSVPNGEILEISIVQ